MPIAIAVVTAASIPSPIFKSSKGNTLSALCMSDRIASAFGRHALGACMISGILVLIGIPTAGYAGGIQGRSVPAPLYGVTLDNVANSLLAGETTALDNQAQRMTARVNFDPGTSPSWYLNRVRQLGNVAYIMGQLIDSSEMCQFSVKKAYRRAQKFTAALTNNVDVWEIGNEINGNWLCKNAYAKMAAMYDVVAGQQGTTALTFFYEGEPGDPNNCIARGSGGTDMFSWISKNLQSGSAEAEKIRLGLDYALVSWYPDQCPGENPDWAWVFNKLAAIFPNAKVGFGEIGTANPQHGSQYEINLIDTYYPMATKVTGLPGSYIGGYFWWYYAEEMVPWTEPLWSVLNGDIQ